MVTKRKRPQRARQVDARINLSLAGFIGVVAFVFGGLLFIQLWAWLMAGWFA